MLLCHFFDFWREIVLGVTYLPYQSCHCVFFWLRREIVLGCTDQFFWLWQEIVLGVTYLPTIPVVPLCQFFGCGGKYIVFGCTVSKKDSYLVSLIERESANKCAYLVRLNTLLLCISLLCIYLVYCTDPQTHRLDHLR